MKRIITAFAFGILSLNAIGQTNTFPPDGNVGILTTNPLFPLDVRGIFQLVNKNSPGATWDNLRMWSEGENSFIESNGDEKGLIIKSNGGGIISLMSNVGIGTLSPTEQLSVNGKIRAREIKVELSSWPDYVFAKEYQLLTLQETEKHIKEKGHLPGIPSAVEVKSNGVDLGEMNARLLQKIEELTLHLIEQNKKMDAMQKDITILKSKPNRK